MFTHGAPDDAVDKVVVVVGGKRACPRVQGMAKATPHWGP